MNWLTSTSPVKALASAATRFTSARIMPTWLSLSSPVAPENAPSDSQQRFVYPSMILQMLYLHIRRIAPRQTTLIFGIPRLRSLRSRPSVISDLPTARSLASNSSSSSAYSSSLVPTKWTDILYCFIHSLTDLITVRTVCNDPDHWLRLDILYVGFLIWRGVQLTQIRDFESLFPKVTILILTCVGLASIPLTSHHQVELKSLLRELTTSQAEHRDMQDRLTSSTPT
jgi:hypothetical protein